MTEPTDAEIRGLAATGNGVYQDDETAIWEITDPSLMKLVHDALTKWGTPAHSGEPVAWLDPWAGTKVTTDYDAYGKHGIPLYTTPQPTHAQAGAEPTPQPTQSQAGAVPLSYEQIQDLLLCGDPTDEEMRLIRIGWDAAHASKGASMAKFKGRKLKHGSIAQPSIPKPCAACHGSGRYDSTGSPKCSACNGTGIKGGQHGTE